MPVNAIKREIISTGDSTLPKRVKKLFRNGDCYEGGWLENKFHGRGKFLLADDGTIYEGEWVKGGTGWRDGFRRRAGGPARCTGDAF